MSQKLAMGIVRGGEGATKLVTVRVTGAGEWAHAEKAARTIANSLLVKTAIHGGDPNWGRLVAAAGRAGVPFELAHASVKVGGIPLFANGQPHDENAPNAADTKSAGSLETPALAIEAPRNPSQTVGMRIADHPIQKTFRSDTPGRMKRV